MDRSLYVAMTGAAQTMRAQAEVAHNLANAGTAGFKAELSAFRSVPVLGDGERSRINAVAQGSGWDLGAGPQITTGRDLDVAVQGQGWIAVQAPDGSEGYTRAGGLQISADGLLTTAAGQPVLGDGGPISVPPYTQLSIGGDGTVSVVPQGQGPATLAVIGRIKLVNPEPAQLVKGGDGLMHLAGGNAPADAGVRLASGVIESSNVNPSEQLVRMIELARQFEMQVRGIRTADDNARVAAQLLQAT
ncbi:flagellar basal-body rod protein FlgF [Mizugakiibacter sediminis]|uniref:Flagellar basal-body rod protein FlgF n=1 Tax=Mizugakiibacter sediminis TaxID=1475481 RepID=A0A0K8QK99_9GAMM|nr:flagellar basal-body rod protein FlgF [Mizugakiibacter sediminis]GAP65244.1 flagellar basal-body rod protein FlgF [Mizugakiibacter sediminis]